MTNNARYMLCTSIETTLANSYIHVIFLIMYGAMWKFNIKFDAGLFALLYVLLNYTRQCCISFFNLAVRDVLNYMTAQKRIQVRWNRILSVVIWWMVKLFYLGISFTGWIGTWSSTATEFTEHQCASRRKSRSHMPFETSQMGQSNMFWLMAVPSKVS